MVLRAFWGAAFALMLGASLEVEARPEQGARFWMEAKQRRVHSDASELSRVARRALPSVVSITTRQAPAEDSTVEPESGLGAGFIISADGYVLTSAHVVKDAREVSITLTHGSETLDLPARIVGQDALTDVALLKVDAPHPLPVLPLGESKGLEIADWVVAIGNPFGLQHSVTVGVVSHKGRSDVAPGGVASEIDLIQTDASINPGSSGGPLLDLDGHVVGIANAVNVSGQGIGFAIPIEVAKTVLPHLRDAGEVRRGWLGISVQDVTPDMAKLLGIARGQGVLVSEVVEGGPGSRAGLQVGDVITRVDAAKVVRANSLRWEVNTRGIGRPVRLSFERQGQKLVRDLELEVPPAQVAATQAVPRARGAIPAAGGAQ